MVVLAGIPSKTAGKKVFESYLDSVFLPFEFEKEHQGKRKRPDYTIGWKGCTVVLDVKDFDPPTHIATGPMHSTFHECREHGISQQKLKAPLVSRGFNNCQSVRYLPSMIITSAVKSDDFTIVAYKSRGPCGGRRSRTVMAD